MHYAVSLVLFNLFLPREGEMMSSNKQVMADNIYRFRANCQAPIEGASLRITNQIAS